MTNSKTTDTKTILIVDDVEYSRQLLRSCILSICDQDELTTQHFHIFNAANGQSTLSKVEQHRPDIVFLDIELPDINGLELLSQIKQVYPKIFVIMVSGNSTISNVKGSLNNGAAGFIVKPFSADKVSEALKKFEKNEKKMKK